MLSNKLILLLFDIEDFNCKSLKFLIPRYMKNFTDFSFDCNTNK